MSSNNYKKYLETIKNWCGYNKFVLLYRGSRDGTTSKSFHDKCDNQSPTITLYKNDKGNIFGGFSPIPWKNEDKYIQNKNCFIFTLCNIYNTEPYKFPVKNENGGVLHNKDYGPTFGNVCDISIYSDYKTKDSYTDFPCKYQDILGKGRSIFTGNNDNNINNFKIDDIDVFKLQ